MDLEKFTHSILDQAFWFGIRITPVYAVLPDGTQIRVRSVERAHVVKVPGGHEERVLLVLEDGETE